MRSLNQYGPQQSGQKQEVVVTGTLVNVGAVLAGGCLGSFLGDRLPHRMREMVLQGIGLVVLVVGMEMALKTGNPLIVLGSIVVGGMLGEWWMLERRLDLAGKWLETKVARVPLLSGGDFTRGFVTATLVFCVGPMAVLGSIQEGVSGDSRLLLIKSVLDGFSALAFAAAMGMGVTFAAVSVLAVQGTLTVGGSFFHSVLTPPMVAELSATGGVMVLGIGLLLLDIRKIRVANLLPALVLAPSVVALLAWMGIR
jgi:uncharacterized membrane protein YqgA involved in biofilm formation